MSPRTITVTELTGDEITIDLDEVLYMDSRPDGTTTLITETDLVYCVREAPEVITERGGSMTSREMRAE